MVPWGDIFVQIAFWFLTACTLGGGLGVVTSKNLFHSALFLILSLFGVAGYYVLLSAGFLAVVQLLIYVGAIAILILFAIMFSRRIMTPGVISPFRIRYLRRVSRVCTSLTTLES